MTALCVCVCAKRAFFTKTVWAVDPQSCSCSCGCACSYVSMAMLRDALQNWAPTLCSTGVLCLSVLRYYDSGPLPWQYPSCQQLASICTPCQVILQLSQVYASPRLRRRRKHAPWPCNRMPGLLVPVGSQLSKSSLRPPRAPYEHVHLHVQLPHFVT